MMHKSQINPMQMKTRAVSPFDMKRIRRFLLSEERYKNIANQTPKNIFFLDKTYIRNHPPTKKEDFLGGTFNANTMIDILNQWQEQKARVKLNCSLFFPVFSSAESIVEQ